MMHSVTKKAVVGLALSAVLCLLAYVSAFAIQYHVPANLESITADDGSAWERINTPGFGSINNFSIVAMHEYKGRLYAMTRNETEGAEVWRTDGTTWEQVLFPGGVTNGIYNNTWINNVWARMIVYKGKLYFAFSSGLQGSVLKSTGCEIWRYDGTTWEAVISDKRDTDESGSITGISGCADADGDTTASITDSSKSWTVDEWAGGILQITSGDGVNRKFNIVGNTADTLIVQQNEKAGDVGSEYTICAGQSYGNPYPVYSYSTGDVLTGDSYEIGMGWDESGFGEFWNKTVTDMIVNDHTLYVSTGLNYEYGAQVWYTSNGDDWTVTQPANSFGNFHPSASGYPNSQKPVSSSITNLAFSEISGENILYAGGTGTSGSLGQGSRMARLTDTGWELIVDPAVDANDTGTNENGFNGVGDMMAGNFMPWNIISFKDKLVAGINSLGGLRILYSQKPAGDDTWDIKNDGSWVFTVGEDGALPAGFDGVMTEPVVNPVPIYKNIAPNLFKFGDYLFAGVVCAFIPEYPNYGATQDALTGAPIWKSSDAQTWTMVTGNGLGDTDTVMFEAFTVFNGQLYLAGSKGASSTPAGLGGGKVYRLAKAIAVTTPDQTIASNFTRHTVTGITTPLPVLPDVPGFLGASFLTIGDLDDDGVKEIICTSGVGLNGSIVLDDSTVGIFTWDGADLTTWTQSIINDTFAFANEAEIRDMNGDGLKDLLIMDNFIAGWATGFPAGMYYLENQGGDITLPSNWIKRIIYEGDTSNPVGESSYHRACFVDLDGDGLEDLITAKVNMEYWQTTTNQYRWVEWWKQETDMVTYPGGFSGPYEIGEGGGFLFNIADIDGDGDMDVIAPQFFIQTSGGLVVKGKPLGDDINGDTLAWFENPGTGASVFNKWNRYTIDNWYTSENPLGKGFDAMAVDIDNDGADEIVMTNHNHQAYKPDGTYQSRIWSSGVYYYEIPADPKVTSNWTAVTIDQGDPFLDPYDAAAVAADDFAVNRAGGPYGQGSPGQFHLADANGDGFPEMVVAGDGRGVLYYYESQGFSASQLNFKRATLYEETASMPGDAVLNDIDDDGDLDVIASLYDTSVDKGGALDSSSIFVFEYDSGVAPEVCGNNIIEGSEECDGTAGDCEALYGPGYECSDSSCQCEYVGYCGDDIVQPGLGEQCEDNADCAAGEECKSCNCEPTLIELENFVATGRLGRVILTWTTAAEIDNVGFNLYRADSADGEYEQINANLIAAKGSPTSGATYHYVDRDVATGSKYFYKLVDVDVNGNTTEHGPESAGTGLLGMSR